MSISWNFYLNFRITLLFYLLDLNKSWNLKFDRIEVNILKVYLQIYPLFLGLILKAILDSQDLLIKVYLNLYTILLNPFFLIVESR